MTIFYFTSTGNCLAVAKKIGDPSRAGSNLVSIPQIIGNLQPEYKDDIIGIIFPIYGFFLPKIVRRFIAGTKISADYTFAIGTYGNLPGACMRNAQKYALEHGSRIDYAESLLMVDNYLPGFEVKDQIAMLPKKNTDENLARIIADITARKKVNATASVGWRFATAAIRLGEKAVINGKQAQRYIVNGNCIKCGICAKVCPTRNITVTEDGCSRGAVTFGDNCEACLGCVHNCPKNAIHLKNEKSAERFRNPDVSLNEIVAANEQKQTT
ncbi:(Fe-S)-binding protein [Clostridia bacterium]|nr:(Fe-S)-binding protein [Clostridia bacterium]GHV35863.1 (Fe-S)-binding protein [Clostridia bacterium]